MRDRLIELLNKQSCPSPLLCDKNCKYAHLESCYAERVADYLLANGVIVPPCKVGRRVYLVRDHMNDFIEGEVVGVKTTEFSRYIKVFLINDNRYTEIPFTAFGKSVFHTKEEAKQALKGGEG